MTVLSAVLLGLSGIVLAGFYAGAETGLYTLDRFRLHRRQHRGERAARLLAWLISDPVGLLVTFLLGHNLAVYLVTTVAARSYAHAEFFRPGGAWWRTPEAAATATLVLPLFIFAELLPKNLFRRNAERLSYQVGWVLAATRFLLLPVVWLLRAIAELLPLRWRPALGLGMPKLSTPLLDRLLSHGRETGELTVEQERLARNVLRMGSRRVRELARPLGSDCCTAETEAGVDAAMRTLAVPADELAGRALQRLAAVRSRLALVIVAAPPAEARGRPAPAPPLRCRDVVGYVRLFDLLAPGVQGRKIRELARPVPRLSADATLRRSLTEMQRACADVAVVEQPSAFVVRRRPGAAPAAGSDRPVHGVVRLSQIIGELLAAPQPERGRAR